MTAMIKLTSCVRRRQHCLAASLLAALFATPSPAASLAAHAPRQLAILGARLYASPDADAAENSVVLIKDGRILKVGSRADTAIPPGVPSLDARGAVLTAGFWNSHVHFMSDVELKAATAPAAQLDNDLQAMLTRWGFTTVFDLASSTDATLKLRQRIESGEIVGPKILTVGDPFFPEHGTPIYVRDFMKAHGFANDEVATPQAAAARAAQQLKRGTDGVKIFAGAIVGGEIGVLPMRIDVAKAAVEQAHRRGKPAFAHPTNLAGLNVAMQAGVDILAHPIEGVRGALPADWNTGLMDRMRRQHMALIPTMTLFEVEARRSGESADDLAKILDTVTTEVKQYSAAGSQILFGTDVGYTDAFDTKEEYRLMSAALSWREILRSLTTAPAGRFGFGTHKGRIAAGMDADLVLLDADPAQDPTAFSRVRTTIRAGSILWNAGNH
jgi:imidazolonepropionase-like amidohydrolase